MKRALLVLAMGLALGCEALTDMTPSRPATPRDTKVADASKRATTPAPRTAPQPSLESLAVCSFDLLTIPRAQFHDLDQLFTYTEAAGIYGPTDKVLALNGLRMARMDKRFAGEFAKTLALVKRDTRRNTWIRLPEGRDQVFDVGENYSDVSLFVFSGPDAVTGRFFAHARYSMTLALNKVPRDDTVEYGISWQVHTGSAFQRNVAVAALDAQVELEKGQSLVIAPTGFTGRSVDRALLSGVDEGAMKVTFFVITPAEIHKKPEPPPEKADQASGTESPRERTSRP